LGTLGHSDESRRLRSLAIAYQQIQQAHSSKPSGIGKARNPRGTC
jgi:hypothetical protein